MPHYHFHHCIGDRMMWDRIGCDLPDLRQAPDPDEATALWTDILAGHVQPGRVVVITDALGKVLFVTMR